MRLSSPPNSLVFIPNKDDIKDSGSLIFVSNGDENFVLLGNTYENDGDNGEDQNGFPLRIGLIASPG